MTDRARTLDGCLGAADAEVRRILEQALTGGEVSWEEGVALCGASGPALHALCLVADTLREEQAGDQVAYVVNRNVNFTNACVKACKFCAFARGHRAEGAYFLGEDEVIRRMLEARELGATEVCVQAGLAPGIDGRLYIQLCRALKKAAPDIHVHAFSPEEVKYGAGLAGISFRQYLEELKDAGLGSLPGTSAEVLDDAVRAKIAPTRISTAEWIEVVKTAHEVGLPTTSTIMYGHLETDGERIRHLDLLRSIQKETGGFTEFVPLSFVHHESPMFRKGLLNGMRPGPSGNDVIRLFAIARLMLGATFKNIQVSWVKEGLRQAQWLLSCGANDLGGTLMNESISTSAGAGHGQVVTPSELRRVVRDAGRKPVQRDTLYRTIRAFGDDPSEDPPDPLDAVHDTDERFGTYAALTRDDRFRFQLKRAPRSP
ncbi:MAG TPA: 5-amino-6-(D-ribitylamino)uracil--L-tyrosine 4-hydroxyphenyl transferase CofH [Polyangiaceae bacterium]|jgi:FO synthase subunit 2